MTSNAKRSMQLSTLDLYRLDWACKPLNDAFGDVTYLVGSMMRDDGKPPRDVDVRTILPDKYFDHLFTHSADLWGLICSSIAMSLSAQTGLNIDYQIQRATEANANHKGPRNPLGGGGRAYAGYGDATCFDPEPRKASE